MSIVRATNSKDPLSYLEEAKSHTFYEMKWGSAEEDVWLFVQHDENDFGDLQALLAKAGFHKFESDEENALWIDCLETWRYEDASQEITVDIISDIKTRELVSATFAGENFTKPDELDNYLKLVSAVRKQN